MFTHFKLQFEQMADTLHTFSKFFWKKNCKQVLYVAFDTFLCFFPIISMIIMPQKGTYYSI